LVSAFILIDVRHEAQKIDIDNSKAKEVMSRKPITIKINSFLSEETMKKCNYKLLI